MEPLRLVENLPAEILRILSYHGPVAYTVGGGSLLARGTAAVAPFEDTVFLLVPAGAPVEAALQADCVMRLTARAPDGRYDLRLVGRASAGQRLGGHPRRPEIAPWAPEGADPRRLLAVPFVAEQVELSRGDDEVRQRHFGPTPAGRTRPRAVALWVASAFSGMPGAFAVLLIAGVWAWLALQGPTWPLRPLALALAVTHGLALLAGARLFARAYAFDQWRRGLCPPEEAGVLPDGLLAPAAARRVGAWLVGGGLVAGLVAAAIWGPALPGLALGLSGVWLLAPAWAIHLSSARERAD